MFARIRCTCLFLYLLSLSPRSLPGQVLPDSVRIIPLLEVSAMAIRTQSSGSSSRYWSADSTAVLNHTSLADLLALETTVHIKSYGPGGLATPAIRGSSAAQTLVLWNGLPLQSPMLGQLDLSLIPGGIMEQTLLTPGGNSSQWGSGAIGGLLSLKNQVTYEQRTRLKSATQIGSFGHFQQQLDLQTGSANWQTRTKWQYQQAANDFFYSLGPALPARQQTNAARSQQSLLQDIYWKPDEQYSLAAHLWRQHTFREIPPTNVQTRSEAYQRDRATRMMLDFTKVAPRNKWNLKMGFWDESLDYHDPMIRLASESDFRTWLADFLYSRQFKKQQHLLLGSTQSLIRVETSAYGGLLPQQWRSALWSTWRGNWRTGQYQLSLRREWVAGQPAPLMPSLGLDWQPLRRLLVKMKVSRNYRLPTFNDLYWLPGGNTQLLPETGWSQELGLERLGRQSAWTLDVSLTAFNRIIDNWILWSLEDGQSFWSASNLAQVWSRGLEPRLNLCYAWSSGSINWHNGYDWIRSTNQIAVERPRLAAGSQLLYTPVHQFFSRIQLRYNSFTLLYQHRLSSSSQGQLEVIPGFQTARFSMAWQGQWAATGRLQLQGSINNIWNADYMLIERRPMPGRHFQLSVLFSNL